MTAAARANPKALGNMQISLCNARNPQFWAAVDGTFTVLARGTRTDFPADADINDGTALSIWWSYKPSSSEDSRAGSSALHGFVENVTFHNGASMAAEMHTMARGYVERHRFAESGWLYLLAEPDWFWSAMILRRRSGNILPAPGPGLNVKEHTVWGRETTRMQQQAKTLGIPLAGSHSLAAVALTQKLPMPFGLDDAALPATDAERPEWWLAAGRPWEEQLARCIAAGKAPCLYYITEAGCRATDCPYLHDDAWAKHTASLKRELSSFRR